MPYADGWRVPEFVAARWQEALELSKGNITKAGRELGIGKTRSKEITARCGLGEFARTLRIRAMGRARGRPPNQKKQAG